LGGLASGPLCTVASFHSVLTTTDHAPINTRPNSSPIAVRRRAARSLQRLNISPLGAAGPARRGRCPGYAGPPAQVPPGRKPQPDAPWRDRKAGDAARSVQNCTLSGLAFDLTTPRGPMIATIIAGIADFERELIQERIRSGIAAANARGKRLGRQQRPKSDSRRSKRDAATD
jgi:Resolvase, N terminal domain